MKSAMPLLALGAVALFVMAGSKKSTTSSGTGTSGGGLKIPAKKTDPTPKKPPGGLIAVPAGQVKCDLLTEYYDVNTKKCVKFWKEGETNLRVELEINDVLKEMGEKKLDVANICTDIDEFTPNPLSIQLFKEVLFRLWEIPSDILPPNTDPQKGAVPPTWIKIVWDRVIDIYLEKICNTGFDPYA